MRLVIGVVAVTAITAMATVVVATCSLMTVAKVINEQEFRHNT